MELISRDDVIKTVHNYFIKLLDNIPTETDEDGDTVYSDMKTVNSLLTINKWLTKEIKAIPTIEERKEGEWLDNKWLGKKCSVCSWELHYINFGQFKYCPYCGAKMERSE